MSKKALILFISGLTILLTQVSQAAVYNCKMKSPKPSLYFDRDVKLECDLDSLANPKFVVLSGSSKVPLNTKAQYVGKDVGNLYEYHRLPALDGQIIELHTASAMFTETVEASFFTVEPGRVSALWVCYMEL